MRCMWTSFDYISGLDNIRKFDDIVVGGVVHCRMFQYPEAPKPLPNKWCMRRILTTSDTLKQIPYPDPQTTVQTEPVHCIMKLPDYVFVTNLEDIKIGIWDQDQQ